MSISSNGTAGDVNTLLRYLLPASNDKQFDVPVTEDEAKLAAQRLAAAAHKKLYAGLGASDVAKAWPKNRPAPSKGGARG